MNKIVRKNDTRKSAELETSRRLWTFKPASLDNEARTFDVVAATETPVLRAAFFDEPYEEVLRCTTDAINPSRLKGLPVLDSHDRSSVLAVIGQVTAWRISDRQLIATIKIADSERGRAAFDLVSQGMLNRVSIGYSVDKGTRTDGPNGRTVLTATRWTPYEVSLVSVPADPNATIRGDAKMTRRLKAGQAARTNDDDILEDDDTVIIEDDTGTRSQRSPNTERQFESLMRSAESAGLSRDSLETELADVRTISRAREIVFDMLADKDKRSATSSVNPRDMGRGERDVHAQILDALVERLGGATAAAADNRFRGARAPEMIRNFYSALGDPRADRMSDSDAAQAFLEGRSYGAAGWSFSRAVGEHTTSDFQSLLVAAGDRVLMERFSADASPLKMFSRKRNGRDFRPQTHIRPGEAPLLLEVKAESGEVIYGTLGTESVSFSLKTYARGFRLSRKAIINDDLGAFTDFLSAFADSANQTEGNLFFELLSANSWGGAKYTDGKNFFHADHGNLASVGAPPSVESLSVARRSMRIQKNVNGTGTAGVTPKYLVVGPSLETVAQKVVAEFNATKTDDVNPFSGQIQVAVENRYDGNGWWLFADPSRRPAFMHGYLEGRDGPFFIRQEHPSVAAGAFFECILDFGCGPYEYRAAYRNPGV